MGKFDSRCGYSTVTAAEIARRLGVSRTTVSTLLRGETKTARISADTARRVHTLAEELNYVPNALAHNFRRQRSTTIGLVLAEFSGNWADHIMLGMEEVLAGSGYTPFVGLHRWKVKRAREELFSCLQRRDVGVICQPFTVERDVYAPVLDGDIPFVFLADRPEGIPEASFVGWDAGPAARVAVEHLIDTGRRRIGFIGMDYPMEMSRARHEAYVDVLREAGLPFREDWNGLIPMQWGVGDALVQTVNDMFAPGQEHPDALFALNDAIALPLLQRFDQLGIRVPDDVAVIGMGDLDASHRWPASLSTVREPLEEMGKAAAAVVLELTANPRKAPIHRLIPGQDLKARKTT